MEATIETDSIQLDRVQIGKEYFYKISNSDALRPFFISIVSDADHWMFISSNGGLTAGRKNAESAFFPYYTDDKITESADITGSKSIFQVREKGQLYVWEPFSERFEGKYKISRNLYKNIYGNKVLFEEQNHDLNLTFRYEWSSSNLFGFVRTSSLLNNSEAEINVSILDGIQNIVPYGVNSYLQNNLSNLGDAYKRSELDRTTGMGLFALSAIVVDRAEPSEALKANTVWSAGIEHPKYLLSSLQIKNFRKGNAIAQEIDVKAEKGAYFMNASITLLPKGKREWMMVAEVNQNHAAIAKLALAIKEDKGLVESVKQDITKGTNRLIALNAGADGLQLTSDHLRDTRHFANTLFNIMRGGIFDHNYEIERWDFSDYLSKANMTVFENASSIIDKLPDVFSQSTLKALAYESVDLDFRRLCLEYMPLKFSRRHGDPSRPWNKFSINTRSEEDGSKVLDYQGNWRDIFQNWEALAHSYPEFMESMIHKFLNATTFDGYNPYRVTKDGFDWESIEPDDPWSYIGYWGDHQIIYLLKFLEFIQDNSPGKLNQLFDQQIFVYANVPYKIKSYKEILENPKDTIVFDEALDHQLRAKKEIEGADAVLLQNEIRTIYKVNFIEKILATVLAKLSNFIPEGGIWMNTQRPEWNDANNALVGNGVSMVTLYYLRRFLNFFSTLVTDSELDRVEVSNELIVFYKKVVKTFEDHQHLLKGKITDKDRKSIMDGLGEAASQYRNHIYNQKFWGEKRTVSIKGLTHFIEISLQYIDHTIEANKRADGLYHAYNLMTVESDENISIAYLSEMLEGQVAILSSGYLSSTEALKVLDALKASALFREDQYSYILYPNKELPCFLQKNNLPAKAVKNSILLQQLVAEDNVDIIEKDVNGQYHFNGNLRNADDLKKALDLLSESGYSEQMINENTAQILASYESVFNHKAFTGRSGTFFGYEGLGSIYWHMVSKLQLAVQECCLRAVEENESEKTIGGLFEHYYEINEGIGVHKSPSLYGAFPTDPYSHTPAGKGAQQPGMTGQVKEDVLCRFGELGVFVKEGQLLFNPCLLRKDEFLNERKIFDFIDVDLNKQQLHLEVGSLCFTYCQVPILYKVATENSLEVFDKSNTIFSSKNLKIDAVTSRKIFERTGEITKIVVGINETTLR